jgi:hypothetical protein
MIYSSQAIHLPGLNNFPGELFMQDNEVKLMIQGSMWTLTPDVNQATDIDYSVKMPFPGKSSFTKIQIEVLTVGLQIRRLQLSFS